MASGSFYMNCTFAPEHAEKHTKLNAKKVGRAVGGRAGSILAGIAPNLVLAGWTEDQVSSNLISLTGQIIQAVIQEGDIKASVERLPWPLENDPQKNRFGFTVTVDERPGGGAETTEEEFGEGPLFFITQLISGGLRCDGCSGEKDPRAEAARVLRGTIAQDTMRALDEGGITVDIETKPAEDRGDFGPVGSPEAVVEGRRASKEKPVLLPRGRRNSKSRT